MLLESVEAHSGAVWSISMAPDKVHHYGFFYLSIKGQDDFVFH